MHSTVFEARMPLGLSMESSAVKAVFQVSVGSWCCGWWEEMSRELQLTDTRFF